jgi:hypothetical protein
MNNLEHVSEHGFLNWWRCRRVEFDDGVATWELGESGKYSFSTAYQAAPHIQLGRSQLGITEALLKSTLVGAHA